ncbi:hypothetical protein HMPREF9419_1310 [Prevotella nigrescens ATCC 33563]|nr:hypothetical protein HMPREF9419_1310 [Prevotella nigrescens ATCC 33563]
MVYIWLGRLYGQLLWGHFCIAARIVFTVVYIAIAFSFGCYSFVKQVG